MNDDYVLWELISFSKTLESIIDLISRFNFLSAEHLKFVLEPIKVELIINNNKINDRRKRNNKNKEV